jgi:hypothetical protein
MNLSSPMMANLMLHSFMTQAHNIFGQVQLMQCLRDVAFKTEPLQRRFLTPPTPNPNGSFILKPKPILAKPRPVESVIIKEDRTPLRSPLEDSTTKMDDAVNVESSLLRQSKKIHKAEKVSPVISRREESASKAAGKKKRANKILSVKTILKNHVRHCHKFITAKDTKEVRALAEKRGIDFEVFKEFVEKINQGLNKFDFLTIRAIWSGGDMKLLSNPGLFSMYSKEELSNLGLLYLRAVKIYFKRIAVLKCYSYRVKKAGVGMLAAIQHILKSLTGEKCTLAYHSLLLSASL